MRYGLLFIAVSALLVMLALLGGGPWLLGLWPATSFAIVAVGYFFLGPRVYGKSANGTISKLSLLLLLPFLLYLWCLWRIVRLFRQETAYDRLSQNLYIGRRLMAHEFPSHFSHVIDLTCEFSEPKKLREAHYHSFQILDGDVPALEELESWVAEAVNFSGDIYIHCAEGHGRTGLFAAALLVRLGECTSAEDALAFVKSKRPLVRLGRRQRAMLTLM